MDSNELQETIKSRGSKFVYNQVLLSEDVYFLRERHKADAHRIYHEIKMEVSETLDVPVKNVAIVGSAKTGYSLTPGRNYSPFSEKSDIDLVIVSDNLFRDLWERKLNYVNSATGQQYSAVAKNIFRHFISIKADEVKGDQLQYFTDWISSVDKLRMALQLKYKLPAEINYRVYDSWKYVEQYHIAGLNALIGEK